MFSGSTEQYAYPFFPWQQDQAGFYFPDAVLEPFMQQARLLAGQAFQAHVSGGDNALADLNRHRLQILDCYLTIQKSCDIVVSALSEFDPVLGAQAREVINAPERWQLAEAPVGEAAGICYAANSDNNLNPFAVIEYQYDGTVSDPIYIGHELGHLFGDDFLNQAGFSSADLKRHMAEVQAFFVQNIVYDYLSRHPDPAVAQAAGKHFVGEITRSLYHLPLGTGALTAENTAHAGGTENAIAHSFQLVVEEWLGGQWQEFLPAATLNADIQNPITRDRLGISAIHQHSMAGIIGTALFLHAKNQPPEQRGQIISSLLGKNGPLDIIGVLANAGIQSSDALDMLAKSAVSAIVLPVAGAQAVNVCPAAGNTCRTDLAIPSA